MKFIHGILGCALVAGLTAHAAAQQNGTVIDNVLYTPLNIKLLAQFNNSKGKIHEATVTSKDILKFLGFSTKDVLATDYDGFSDNADVVVIENGEVLEDLSSDDIFFIEFNDLVTKHDKDHQNGSYTEAEKGVLSMDFDFTAEAPTAVVAGAEVPPSGTEISFEVSGVYAWLQTGGAVKNEDTQKTTTKLVGFKITGDGFDDNTNPDIKPAISGSNTIGDFLIEGGTVVGNGSGTLEIGG